jgi:hypothetical protein
MFDVMYTLTCMVAKASEPKGSKKRTRGAGPNAGPIARFGMQLSHADYDDIERAAAKEGITMTAWVRMVVKTALGKS